MKSLLLAGILLFSLGLSASNTENNNNTAHLEVRNDYSFTIKLEVKCGKWLGDRFEYEERFTFPEGKTTELKVPKKYDRCQVWPSHRW